MLPDFFLPEIFLTFLNFPVKAGIRPLGNLHVIFPFVCAHNPEKFCQIFLVIL